MSNPNWIGRPEKNYAGALPGQLELATVIDHSNSCGQCGSRTVESCNDRGCYFFENGNGEPKDTQKPAGVLLAKMLSQYDDQPSSQLWCDIQRLAREILK